MLRCFQRKTHYTSCFSKMQAFFYIFFIFLFSFICIVSSSLFPLQFLPGLTPIDCPFRGNSAVEIFSLQFPLFFSKFSHFSFLTHEFLHHIISMERMWGCAFPIIFFFEGLVHHGFFQLIFSAVFLTFICPVLLYQKR